MVVSVVVSRKQDHCDAYEQCASMKASLALEIVLIIPACVAA